MQQEFKNLSIYRKTSGEIPKLAFLGVKEAILGKTYELSLVFPDNKEAAQLHREWKKKRGPANVLSFPLSDGSGEMFISLSQARKEAHKHGHGYQKHVLYLFIHGCLHLKGFDHGEKMESLEKKYLNKFFK